MAGLFGRGGKASAVPWFAAGVRERAGARLRATSTARALAKRSLIAFLTFLLAFGSTPAELWAEGAEGLAQAVTAQPEGSSADGSSTEGTATENSAASQAAGAAGVEGAAENEGAATGSASAGSPASGSGAQGAPSGAQDGSAKAGGSSSAAASSASGTAPSSAKASYAVSFADAATGESRVFKTGDTVRARMKVTGASGFLDAGELSFQWKVGDKAKGPWTDIEGATGETLKLDATLAGRYVNCVITVKASGDSATRSRGFQVTDPDPAPALSRVELSYEGSPAAPESGQTVTARALGASGEEISQGVSWSWYASDSAERPSSADLVAGASQASFTIPADGSLAGKHLFAAADTGAGAVYSAATAAVAPVEQPEPGVEYELTSVQLSAEGAAAGAGAPQGFQVGNTIVPQAMMADGAYSEKEAPADAALTYTWYAASTPSAKGEKIAGYDPADGRLALTTDLVGKYLHVTVSAGKNTVSSTEGGYGATIPGYLVSAAGQFELVRVTLSEPSGGLTVGSTVSATVQARALNRGTGAGSTGEIVRGFTCLTWWVASSPNGPWEQLSGETGATLTVPAAAAGKHLKVVAESGPSSVERAATGTVAGADSLDAVVRELAGYRLSLTYGVDTNVNDVLEAKIRSLGHDDVTVTTSAATFSAANTKATGGVSTAKDATNGDVTYFFINPADLGWQSLDALRQVRLTFTLASGDERVSFSPDLATALPWDEAKVDELLSGEAAKVSPAYADGESADAVTDDFTLPYKAPGAAWSTVTWTSSNEDVISVEGYGFSDYTANVSRPSTDTEVTLTATVGVVTAGGPAKTVTREYRVTVKGKDATAERDELQRKVDAAFTPTSITELGTGAAVDLDAVTGDLQLPTTRKLDIDGGKDGYQVVYSSSAQSPGLTINGYAANAVRPLPGASAQPVDLVLTVTSKKNPDITASKTIRVSVSPLAGDDIDAELALLHEAEAGFAAAILSGQDASSVTGDLDTVTKAYLKDGKLAWARTADEADAVSGGIVPVELPGAGESAGYRLFKSSDPSVIAHENLLVKTPEYNTEVTVSARLASASYARYAALYGADATWGAKLSELAGADVSATVTVRGSTGKDDPDAARTITVTAKVTGASEPAADGTYSAETWAPLTEFTYKKSDHATAWDALTRLMEANGLAYSTEGGEPFSVTSADGKRTLAMEGSGSVWSYWSFYLNGEPASTYASQHEIADGDVLELRYLHGEGTEVPSGPITVDPDAPRPEWTAPWPGFSTAAGSTDAKTPTGEVTSPWVVDLGEQYPSDPIYVGSYLYVAAGSKLLQVDPATGKTVASAALAAPIDSVSRMVYASGVIVVPLHGGRLQAITPDKLVTVWVTEELPTRTTASGHVVEQQSLGTLTVRDGYVYAPTGDGSGTTGYLLAVNLANGAVRWTRKVDGSFYWAGAVSSGSHLVIGDDRGNVTAIDPFTGETAGSPISLGAKVRSTLVSDGTFVYAVDYAGTLHKLTVGLDGSITEVGKVKFGNISTSTPAISAGKIFVGGASSTHGSGAYMRNAALFVIDAATLSVEHEIWQTADGSGLPVGDSKSAPLVSVQGGSTYVYFTVNNMPGGMYRYRLGDEAAQLIYTPEGDYQTYSMTSVIAGPDGTLYYTNGSKGLFALKAGKAPVPDPAPDPVPAPTPTPKPGPKDPVPTPPSQDKPGSLASRLSAGLWQMSRGGKGGAAAGSSAGEKASASTNESTGGTVTATGEVEASTSSSTSGGAGEGSTVAADQPSSSRGLTLAWVLGGVGVTGLVACGIWWLVAGRRRRGDAA